MAFLYIAIVLILVMLCTKPCIVKFSGSSNVHEEIEFQAVRQEEPRDISGSEKKKIASINNTDSRDVSADDVMMRRQNDMRTLEDILKKMSVEDHGHHSFGQVFVHQMIETIEFALGTVSNTASYLRLWALSLAHQQLAETFMNLIFKASFTQDLGLTILLSIFTWMALWAATFGVLMCMDLLECFLHTIRLHWVEFQNKFYKGDGYKFAPYSYQVILQEVLDKQ